MTAILAPAPARIASPPGRNRRCCPGRAANAGKPFPVAPAPGIVRIAGTNAGRPRTSEASAMVRPDPSAALTLARSAVLYIPSIPDVSDIAQLAPPTRSGRMTGNRRSTGTPKTPPRKPEKPSAKPLPLQLLALSAEKCLSRLMRPKPVAPNAAVSTTPPGMPKRNNQFPAPEAIAQNGFRAIFLKYFRLSVDIPRNSWYNEDT